MAITYVGGQVGGRAGSTSTSNVTFALTGGSNSTPQAGDLVVIGVTVASQGRTPGCAVSGYTAQTQINANGTTYDTSLNVSYKWMGGTPDTTFTLPSTGNIADAQRYTVQVWRGVDTGTPLDVAMVPASGTGTGRPDPGSITPTTSGAYVGIIGAGAAGTGASYTAPANYATNFLTGSTADTNDAMIGSGYRAWTSGAEDPAQYTGGTTNAVDSWAAFTYALRPQGAVTHATTGALTGQIGSVVGVSGHSKPGFPHILSSVSLGLGTSASPGAQSVTVPDGAQLVVVHAANYSASGDSTLSLSSNFAGSFTVYSAGDTFGDDVYVAHAVVSSTGAKTITPTWSNSLTGGPLFFVSFISGINTSDYLRDSGVVSTGSASATASDTLTTVSSDLLLVLDKDGASLPSLISGYSLVRSQSVNAEYGNLQACNDPGASSTAITTVGNNYACLGAISIKPASGPVTHATTGALTGQGATVSGSAQHKALHTTTGTLTGQGSTVAGSAARFRAFSTSGALVGQGSAVVGSADHAVVVTHATSGALVGSGSTVAGTAARTRQHATTGTLTGQGAAVVGSAVHNVPHSTSGALVGQGATVSGSSARFRAFATSGELVGHGASVTGSAARSAGPVTHDTSGTLVGQGSSVAGSANRFRAMATSGSLVGQGASVEGSANRAAAPVSHATSGALVGSGSEIAGTSARYRELSASGELTGQGATLSGVSARTHEHYATGELAGQGSAIVGAADLYHEVKTHDTSGALVGSGAVINAEARNGLAIPTGGATDSNYSRANLVELHKRTKKQNEERARLERERIERAEREAAAIVERLRQGEIVSFAPIVTDAPQVAANDDAANLDAATDSALRKISVSFSPLNELIERNSESVPELTEQISANAFSDDDALALIMILAEID